MAVKGDLGALKRLAEKIRKLTTHGFKEELSKALAADAQRLTLLGFRNSVDPYGNPWQPLKHRKGKPLIDTNQMRGSVSAQSTGNGFQLRIGTVYAAVHQYGAHIAPHSRIRGSVMWHNPKTGKLVARSTKLKLVHETKAKPATFGKGITIPARPMIPDKNKGLGPIWTKSFARRVNALIKEKFGEAPASSEEGAA